MEQISLEKKQLSFNIPAVQRSVHFDIGLKIVLAFFTLFLLFQNNGIFLLCSLLVLYIIVVKFWRPYQPSIFLFCFILQWLQVIGFILWMNYNGNGIDKMFKMSSVAIIESLFGFVLMVLIISYRIRGNFQFKFVDLISAAGRWNQKKILVLYLFSTVFLSSIGFVLGQTSGLAQILVTLQGLKWIFFIIYGFIVWTTGANKLIFWFICLFEFLTSFYSFFSDFKTIIFYLILIIMTFSVRIKMKQFLVILTFIFLLGFFFLTWTAIKGEYRKYLNSGERLQKVLVSREAAYTNISDQLSQLSVDKYEKSINFSLYRIQYMMHLAIVMERIPLYKPHENGKLWLSNINYVITPRALFPDKEIFDPSVKTNKYTGKKYATGKKGVAFSLGYFAECYVDFGHILMFFPLVCIAIFVSFIYNFFLGRKRLNLLLRYGIVFTILFPFTSFESDGIFLIGRLFTGSVVMLFLTYTLFPIIQKWAYLKPE